MPKRYIFGFIVALIICSLFLFLNWVFSAQQRLTFYDDRSYGPYGLKAVTLLLRQEGFQLNPTTKLPSDFTQPVILLCTGKIAAPIRSSLLRWVKAGGTVLELTPVQPGLYPGTKPIEHNAKYDFTFMPEGTVFKAVFPAAAGVGYRSKRKVLVTQRYPDQGYYHYRKNYFCYRTHYGKGNIVSWNDLDGLTNIQIKENPDNAVAFVLLFTQLTSSRQIKLLNLTQSEFHFRLDSSLSKLFDRYGSAILFSFIGIGLLFWKISVRFGRPRPLVLTRGRSYHEFLISMAGLFQQAGIKDVVLANLWRSLWRVALDITGLPADTPGDSVIGKLSDITGKDYTDISHLLKMLQSGQELPAPFLENARMLDQYRREFLQWKISKIW